MLQPSGCWPLLPRPFQCHTTDRNKCVARACVALVNLAQLLWKMRATVAAHSQPRCLCFPHISLLTTASAWRQQLQDVFKSPPLMSCWGRPSASRISHPSLGRRAELLASRLHSTCAAGVIMRSGSGGTNWCPPVCPLAPLILVPVTLQREQGAIQ